MCASAWRQRGAVALEFLMLFPFIVAMLYAAAIYGIVFFSQYRMQNAVDRAVSTALYVDRSALQASQLQAAVESKANATLAILVAALPAPLASIDTQGTACAVESSEGVELLRCGLTYNYKANPIVPVMSFGMLGTFPPLPDTLQAEARTAF
ncbi:TadE/TadG family type IV pilus assembly protein [Alloalcanivorax mobilis]|uniref:TadE/TadG family type IV pilus assembly protein n=1 Tax=Alloalcanivorax mobilis TaxID=2019569 RepID=UPI001E3A6C80|nr:TadE/TadG family type IV pilus assembly protein [Alloalcanivorax mobilis]